MKRKAVLFVIVAAVPFSALGQSKAYVNYVARADSLYEAGEFMNAALSYNTAFSAFGGKGFVNDRYNAARSWAMAGEPDSALLNLEKIVYKNRYAAHYRITAESAFSPLHGHTRWKNLIDTAQAIALMNQAIRVERSKYYEPALAAMLDSIRVTDQVYRKELRKLDNRYVADDPETKALWLKIRYHDSINLVRVTALLSRRGWPGPEVVGSGSHAIFLVIQHSDLQTQLKYLPMVKDAARDGKVSTSEVAMLEDRILMGQHKKQIYGTQLQCDRVTGECHLYALDDPLNVDKRRASVDLGPIADYLSHWDIVWDVEAYKKSEWANPPQTD